MAIGSSNFFTLFFFVLFFAQSLCYFEGNFEDFEEFFDKELSLKVRNDNQISAVAVSIIKGNETLFFKGYGYENPFVEPKIPVTDKTVFAVGSISKTFVALSLMKQLGIPSFNKSVNLYLPNELKLDDVIIGDYYSENGYPKISSPANDIKISHMFTHTGGFDEQVVVGMPKYRNLYEDMKSNFPPRVRKSGVVSSYNNYAIGLLGLIVQRESKTQYGDFIQQNIFDKIEMKNTYYGYENAKKDENMCQQSYLYNNVTKKFPICIVDKISARPCGAVFSSHIDMQKYASEIFNKLAKLNFTEEQFNQLFSKKFGIHNIPPINLIFYDSDSFGVQWKGHDGDIDPFHAKLMFNFDENIALYLSIVGGGGSGLIRESLLSKFTLQFMKEQDYCTSIGGEIKKGMCVITEKLHEKWPHDDIDYKKKYEKFIGCFAPTRAQHTTWLKIMNFQSSICLYLHEGKYLRFGLFGQSVLLLENIYINSTDDYILVKYNEINETVEFAFTNSEYVTYKLDEKDRLYLVISTVIGSFEYVGTPVYIAAIYIITAIMIIGTPAAIAILICYCLSLCGCNLINNCCACCRKGKDKGYNKLGDDGDDYMGYDSISINDDEVPICGAKGFYGKSFMIGCGHVIFYFALFALVITFVLNLVHYLLGFIFAQLYIMQNYVYPIEILLTSKYIIIAALVFYGIGIVSYLILMIILIITSCCYCFNRKKENLSFCSCCFYTTMIISLSVFVFVTSLLLAIYYRFSWYYNLFYHI